jgi:lysophospholipase L1-like esterase
VRRPVLSALAALLVLCACAASTIRLPLRPVRAAAPDPRRAPVVFALGDSYTMGIRGITPERAYVAEAARTLGWQVILGGHAGTGFVGTGLTGKTFATLFDEQLGWRPAPDLMLVSGGHNDVWYPPGLVEQNALALLGEIKRRWPRTHLVLMGPLWGGDPGPTALTVRDVLQDAARRLHIPFIDPLRQRWITGKIHTRTGNARRYIRSDGTHPNPAGNRYLAQRLVADLRGLGLAHPIAGRGPASPHVNAGHQGP